jgi:hypothetical protein
VAYDREDLMRRLAAGEWLKTGAVTVLLGVSRKTVHNMCEDGRIRTVPHLGGVQRVCDPEDVRKLMPPLPKPSESPPQG